MRRTAQSIEQNKAIRNSVDTAIPRESKRGKNPNSLANLKPWQPGQSGNPEGRPKNDLAREIAQAVFTQNAELIYAAMAKAILSGSPYAFKELAERGFGKLKEIKELSGPEGGPIQASIAVRFVNPDE